MNDRKTIAFYCDVNIYSGHDIMSAHIANALSGRHDVHFLYAHPSFDQSLNVRVARRRLELNNAGYGLVNLLVKSWGDIRTLIGIFRSIKPDIIVVCQGEYHLCLRGLIAGRLSGARTVMSYIPIGMPYSILRSSWHHIKNPIYRFLVRRFHSFLTISVEQERLLREYIGVERHVYVLENLTEFPSVTITRKKRGHTAYGIISRIQESKGQFKTIEAASKVRACRRDFRFVLFGEGEDVDRLKGAIDGKGLAEHYEFRGWVDDRRRIYSDIDVLLLLSDVEGVPLVLLESLFFETPVLAHRLEGNPVYERYLDPALIFDTVDGLAERMINVERYIALFRKKAKAYRKTVIERHGKKRFEKTLFSIFDKI